MKKFFAFVLCLSFAVMPAYCTITDDFVEQTLDKSLKIKPVSHTIIQDEFAEGVNIGVKNIKPAPIIIDNFAENNKNKNAPMIKTVSVTESIPKVDPSKQAIKKLVIIDTHKAIAVPVRICKKYSTKHKIDEGEYINFATTKEVTINGKVYPAGTPVHARVETVSRNKPMGVPSDLVVGNFSIDGIPLSGEINKVGANRSLWVYPCVYLLTVLFFGTGLLFIPIRGGHAKIRPSQTIMLYAAN